jgi:hypothetical protein
MDLRVAKGMSDRGYDKIRVSVLTTESTEAQCDFSDAKFDYNEKFFSPPNTGSLEPGKTETNKMSGMTLRSSIMTVTPGTTCKLEVGGIDWGITVKTPAKGSRARGLLFADPCVRTVAPGPNCANGASFEIKQRFSKAINALVASDELDFWGIIGDNFYDATGEVLVEFNAELSLEAKAKPFITVPGNHDFWNAGAPELGGMYSGVDHFGYGFMQYYAQDTVAALNGNGSAPFYFPKSKDEHSWPGKSKTTQGGGHGPVALPLSGIPKEENFVFWYQIGNAAMFGYSGAHATGPDPQKNHDKIDPYVEKFCKWVGESDDIVTWMLFGHWNGPNLGCMNGMDTPSIYKVLFSKPGCAAKKGLYFDGHDHCNRITPNPVKPAPDPLPVGYMIGGSGMNGDCAPTSGFVVVDSKAKDVAVDYYDMGQFAQLSDCWDANKDQPFTKCREHATKWRDVPDTEEDIVARRMTSADIPVCGKAAEIV